MWDYVGVGFIKSLIYSPLCTFLWLWPVKQIQIWESSALVHFCSKRPLKNPVVRSWANLWTASVDAPCITLQITFDNQWSGSIEPHDRYQQSSVPSRGCVAFNEICRGKKKMPRKWNEVSEETGGQLGKLKRWKWRKNSRDYLWTFVSEDPVFYWFSVLGQRTPAHSPLSV